MFIEVTDNDTMEVIFKGEAEEFLLTNDYDEEMVEILNRLDHKRIGAKTTIYGNFSDEFTVEKIEDDEMRV